MSHMVAMNVPRISNLESLKRACTDLGLKLDLDKKSATYWNNNKMKCDGVISCPESNYEIALHKDKDGSYSMKMDNFCQKLSRAVGHDGGKLSQYYQVHEHKRIAREMGHHVIGHNVLENGSIELKIKV